MQDCMGENGGSTRFGLARPKMAYVGLARLWLGPLQGAGLPAARLSLARLRAACRRGLGAAQEMAHLPAGLCLTRLNGREVVPPQEPPPPAP